MIYLISDSELRLLCAESGFSANVRSPIASFLSDGAQSEGRMLDENRRGLADLGLFEKKAASGESGVSAEWLLLARILMRPEKVLTVGRRRNMALLFPQRHLVCFFP